MVGCRPINQPPVITSVPVETATVGVDYTYNVVATDPNAGDVLTYSLNDEPSGMVINGTSGVITWTPAAAESVKFTVVVTDEGGLFDDQDVTITVSPAGPEPEPELIGIEVVPKTMTLSVRGSKTITSVTAHYSDGSAPVLDLDACEYESSDEEVATVSAGEISALTPGTATITVSYGGETDTLEVTVNSILLTSIVVLPEEMTLFLGNKSPGVEIESVTAHYSNGTEAEIDLDACSYESSNPDVATVDAGVVKALAYGETTITVSYTEEEITKTVSIEETDTLEVTVVGLVHNIDANRYYDAIWVALDDALPGDTIEVAAGTYPEGVVAVDISVNLLGANAGVCAGVDSGPRGDESIVDAFEILVNDVTVDGFQIDGTSVQGSGETCAIYLIANTSGHTISNNILPGPGGTDTPLEKTRGIIFGYDISDTTVACNEIYGWKSGIYINPCKKVNSNLLFQDNEIHHNNAGIGSDGLNDVSILNNNFSYNVEGFGSSSVGDNVEAHLNNFTDNEAGVNWYSGEDIDATDNWWGHASGPTHSANPLGTGDAVSDHVGYIPWSPEEN